MAMLSGSKSPLLFEVKVASVLMVLPPAGSSNTWLMSVVPVVPNRLPWLSMVRLLGTSLVVLGKLAMVLMVLPPAGSLNTAPPGPALAVVPNRLP